MTTYYIFIRSTVHSNIEFVMVRRRIFISVVSRMLLRIQYAIIRDAKSKKTFIFEKMFKKKGCENNSQFETFE